MSEINVTTFSILAGSTACDAKCPFCISKQTPQCGINDCAVQHGQRFEKAIRLAIKSGATTAMITGKGEPTLKPDQITRYLEILDKYDFPIIELQTNGMRLMEPKMQPHLREWLRLGLTTINVSCVGTNVTRNRKVYGKTYRQMDSIVEYLQKQGFSVRIGVIMVKGWVEDLLSVHEVISYFRAHHHKFDKPFQLTFRPVALPPVGDDKNGVYGWTEKHLCDVHALLSLQRWFDDPEHAKKLLPLPHGGQIYDYEGQNVCLTNCMTSNNNTSNIRQLIFFPDGTLRYDWTYKGAIIF